MRLIDADALADKMMKADMPPHDIGGRYQTGFMDARSMVITAPTIDPVKHGKWKPFDLTWGRSVYACSSCGEAFEVPTEIGKPIYDYCPNCGAKMEGGEE